MKNTLLRFAFNNAGLNELDDLLNGTTSLAICHDDPVAPARVMTEFAKKLDGKFEIKGGFMDGKVLSLDDHQLSGCHLPLCLSCRLRSWAPCWLPLPAWPVVLKQIAEKKGAPAEEPLLPRLPAAE